MQLQTADEVFLKDLTVADDGKCAEWTGTASWTGDALLRVAALRYHEEAEGYHSLVNYHLSNRAASPATVSRVTVTRSGRVTVVVSAEALEPPEETARAMQKARKAGLRTLERTLPASLRRIVMSDGMMHTQLRRHHDPFRQPLPASFGLPTVSAMRLATAQRILEQMAGVGGDCLPDDADDATLVAVGLAAHAGQWSYEQFDDRELTMMLGEDCDDMVIRARSTFGALKALLPELTPRCDRCRRICRFIDGHRMLSCQGHASPPHPGVAGNIIGHVFGLFVRDLDWCAALGLEHGKPVSISNHDFVELLQPTLCEATAATRATPPPLGRKWKPCPEVVEIRTTPGDQSYRSVQQAQEDDCVVYFFQNDKHGRPVGGIDADELIRAPGSAPRPDATFQVLMMKADPSEKARSDAVRLCNEADLDDLQDLYAAYCDLLAKHGVQLAPQASMASAPRYHTSGRFCTDATFCSLKY